MNVLRFAPYCNHNLVEISKVSKSVHEVSGKPSKMINFYTIPTMADFKNKIEKNQKKSKNLIKKEILVVMVSPPLETLARRNLPQLRYWVI